MIATCGHKTDEPISFSYYDGDPNGVSYGSKCFDCFMSTPINYIHNSDLVKVRNIIQRQAKIIELLKQSNEILNKDRRRIYKEMTRLNDLICNGYVYYDHITEEVCLEYIKDGKLARSINQQVKELEDKQGEG